MSPDKVKTYVLHNRKYFGEKNDEYEAFFSERVECNPAALYTAALDKLYLCKVQGIERVVIYAAPYTLTLWAVFKAARHVEIEVVLMHYHRTCGYVPLPL